MKQRNVKSYRPMEQREQKVSLLTLCRVVTEEDDSQQMEQRHPNNSVEASDTCVLTVFPPRWDDETPDDDVVNYATGMFGQWPALLCMDDSHELLVLRNGRLETQHWQPVPK